MNKSKTKSLNQTRWFIEALNTETQRDLNDLGCISSYDVDVPTDHGLVKKLYTSSSEGIKKAKRSQLRLKYRTYRQTGRSAQIKYRPHLSRQ